MSKFINDNFLLGTDSARFLYDNFARDLPVIDFHNHLDPAEAANDKRWENITQLWLYGDHYKWRAMRSNGVAEEFCTGNAPDREKFFKLAETMPKLIRNPIYHWCHLELARYFGIDDLLLGPDTVEEIWGRANEKIAGDFSAWSCLKQSKVEVLCTTDDPISDLSYHIAAAKNPETPARVLPTFRPDKAHACANPAEYAKYLEALSATSGVKISSYADLINALKERHDFFDRVGCRVSDHGIETVYFAPTSDAELEKIFKKLLGGENISAEETAKFKSAVLIECAKMDYESGWVRQLHIGPMRNNNSKMFGKLGPDAGFDSIGESNFAYPLSRHLDALASQGKLGKTILYNIHPKDTEMLAAMLGNFQDSSCAGKMQLGSGWWFMDQMDGMKRQLEAVSALSLLPNFVGMLTDSRSFLSFPRHEYFRRILCALLGADMESGLLPKDFELVGEAVKNISYFNSKNYFKF